MAGKKDNKNKGDASSPSSSSKRKGPVINGFRTIAEGECLAVKAESISDFSMPAEAFDYKPAQDAVITQFKNGDKERKIYCNIELSGQEIEQMKKLQEEAKKQGLEFLPSVTVMAGRFLSRARGDPHKAIKLMLATQDWRLTYFKDGPVADTEVMEDMKHGIVYFSGRDSALRPVIVVRANRIPQQWYKEKRIDKLIRILIFCMEYMIRYMLLPGTIENNVLIVDLKGLSLSQVPLSALSQIYSVMSHHYIGRVFRFYICNMSSALSAIAGMAKNILTDRQKQKLVFLDSTRDLLKDFALHQLEEDLGGTRPILREFFPFPMQAGPFEGGAGSGPEAAAVPRAHEVLTREGATGRVWDPALSCEDNTRLEYTDEAFEWFTRNGLPVPADLQRQHEARLKAEAFGKEHQAQDDAGVDNTKEEEGADGGIANGERLAPIEGVDVERESNASVESEDVIVQDTVVKPRGFFSCKPCWCSH